MAYGQLGAGITENRDKLNNQFEDFDDQENEIASSSGIDWDDENMIKVHDYFEKINKKYYDMDTSELPFMMAQQVYDYNNKDVEASKKMLKHLNDTLEAHPDFDKYRGGDYWSYWDDEFNKIKKTQQEKKLAEASKDIFGVDIDSKESMEGFISRIKQMPSYKEK